MPIPARHLGDDEVVVSEMRPHWVFVAGPAWCTLFVLAAAVAVGVEFPNAPVFVAWILAAAVTVPAVWLAARVVRWRSTSLAVTSERLVLRRGVVRRQLTELRLDRMAEVQVTRTLAQQLVGTGRLVIRLTGGEGVWIDDVRRPRAVQQLLRQRLGPAPRWDGATGGGVPGPTIALRPLASRPLGPDDTPPQGVAVTRAVPAVEPVGGPAAVPAAEPPAGRVAAVHRQLIELDDLRQRGILTEEEFSTKKSVLLSRL